VVYSASASPSVSPSISPSPARYASPEKPSFYYDSAIVLRDVANRDVNLSGLQDTIPSWNNAGRPKNLKPATLGFNIETKDLELYDGSLWHRLPMKKV